MDSGDQRRIVAELAAGRGESLAALSRFLGRNEAYLQQFVKRGSPRFLAERDRERLARYFGVPDSVLGGPEAVETVAVPLLDIGASAGPGRLAAAEQPVRAVHLDRVELRRLGVDPRHAAFLRVEGDSMAPTLLHGDRLLVDRGSTRIGFGGMFVFRLGELISVKRLRPAGERIEILSDNPAAAPIPPARPQDLAIIGRAVALTRTLR